jgi:anti-sigma regulatory factor (Ser/Thr protein kinase)
MQIDERGPRDARADERGNGSAEIAALRATCRRQAGVIETLTRVVGNLRRGVSALKAENAELRAERGRLDDPGCGPRGVAASEPSEWVEARVPLDVCAAAAARDIVEQLLAERVASSVLERLKLVVSELVTNSVRHGDVSAGGHAALRVGVVDGGIWLEVEAPGRDGVVAQRAANARTGDGFGLRIVQALSERWGSERSTKGGTRVWAQLSATAASVEPDFGARDETTLSRADAAASNERQGRQPGRAAVAGRPLEVHVVPQPRAATWGVYVDAVVGALSEHTSETAAESAARAHALMEGAARIVVHDRYHRTRAGVLTSAGDMSHRAV